MKVCNCDVPVRDARDARFCHVCGGISRMSKSLYSASYWNERLGILRREREKVEREIAFTLQKLQDARRQEGV